MLSLLRLSAKKLLPIYQCENDHQPFLVTILLSPYLWENYRQQILEKLLSKILWEKYRQQILEKNIVNKSVRTAAADSWRGDIIEFPINGPPLSEAEQGSYNCTRDIVSSQINCLGVNGSILSAPSCDQGTGMVGDPTTQDNISIWLVWTVC